MIHDLLKPTASESLQRSLPRRGHDQPPRLESNKDAWRREVLNSLPQMIWTADAGGQINFCNAAWHLFAGNDDGTSEWITRLHIEDRLRVCEAWQTSLSAATPFEAEGRLRGHDGGYRWMMVRAVASLAADRTTERWDGSFTDIHQLKTSKEHVTLAACELAHRLRNHFAVVSGMLMLSSRSEPQARAFAEATRGRIEALVRAQDYILPQGTVPLWSPPPTSLHGLLYKLLAPYHQVEPRSGAQQPIDVCGPDHGIGPAAAAALALVFHELATNALKHGALAAADGTLRVTTAVDDEHLRLTWTETGGAVLAGPPLHCGFGLAMARRALRAPLGARIETVWATSGLVVRIVFPRAPLYW